MNVRNDKIIRAAIEQRRALRFMYSGHSRTVEPHIYGYLGGELQLQAYQFDGSSTSGHLPEWRLFFVHKIDRLELLDRNFPGPRPDARRGRFERIVARVDDRPVPRAHVRLPKPLHVYEPQRLADILPDPALISDAETNSQSVPMLDQSITDIISRGIRQRMPQVRREFSEAIQRDQEKNVAMGRHGGIALHFPMQTATREIERRVDFAWEHIKAVLAAGAIARSASLVEDVRVQLQSLESELIGDVRSTIASIAGANGAGSQELVIDARWKEGVDRAQSAAEVYALALQSRDAGRTSAPPGVLLQGTIHSAIIQTGGGATANVHQSFTDADSTELLQLIDELLTEIRQKDDDAGKKDVVISVIQQVQQQAKEKKITARGLAGALTFVLSTWESLKTLGVLAPLKAWLALHGQAIEAPAE